MISVKIVAVKRRAEGISSKLPLRLVFETTRMSAVAKAGRTVVLEMLAT